MSFDGRFKDQNKNKNIGSFSPDNYKEWKDRSGQKHNFWENESSLLRNVSLKNR